MSHGISIFTLCGTEMGQDPGIPMWTARVLTKKRKTEQNGRREEAPLFLAISAGHQRALPDVPSTGGSRKD
jgi:hypothetical protein